MIQQDVSNMCNLLCQEHPTYTPEAVSILSMEQAYEAYEHIANSRIQFSYTQGNCHDRAHIMCLLLEQIGVTAAKIWAFAPGNYSLVDRTLFAIKDKNNISPGGIITWGYHVAPMVMVNDAAHDHCAYIIDPSLFPGGPVPYHQWLEIFRNERGIYFFLDKEFYLFNTLDGNTVYSPFCTDLENCPEDQKVTLPVWFPKVITGDFFRYEEEAEDLCLLPKGLAINETAYRFYQEQIKDRADAPYTADMKAIVGVVDDFTMFIDSLPFYNDYYEGLRQQYDSLLEHYRAVYRQELAYWQDVLNSCK